MSKADKTSSSLRISSFTTRGRGESRAEPPSPTLSLPSSGSEHVEDDLPSTSTSKANGKTRAAPAASSFSSAVQAAAQKRKADTSTAEPSSAKRANGVVKKATEAPAPSSSSTATPSSTKPVARVAPARGAPSSTASTPQERPGPSSASSSSAAAASSSRAAPTARRSAPQKPVEESRDPKPWMNGEGEPACPECGTLVGEDERKEHYRSLHYKELFSSPRALRRCSKLELFLGQRVGVISEGPRQCRACSVEPESRVKLLAHYRQEHPTFYYSLYHAYWAKKADMGDAEVEDQKSHAYLDLPASRPFSII